MVTITVTTTQTLGLQLKLAGGVDAFQIGSQVSYFANIGLESGIFWLGEEQYDDLVRKHNRRVGIPDCSDILLLPKAPALWRVQPNPMRISGKSCAWTDDSTQECKSASRLQIYPWHSRLDRQRSMRPPGSNRPYQLCRSMQRRLSRYLSPLPSGIGSRGLYGNLRVQTPIPGASKPPVSLRMDNSPA